MILSRNRSWIFLFFVVLFGITASTVLFFAFGYRYSFERGIFIYSGSVTIKTIPETVSIEIDGESIPKKRLGLLNNSVHITGLMPGEHTLKLTAPDHAAWEKQVVIESGISREFWNIILPRTDYPLTPLSASEHVVKIFPHPSNDNSFVFVKELSQETSLVFFDYTRGESRQVFSLQNSQYDPNTTENLEWSWFEDGRYVILPLTHEGTLKHFIIDTSDGSFFSLEERFTINNIRTVRWNTENTKELLFLSGTTLYQFSLEETLPPQAINEEVLTYSFADDTLYFVGNQGEVWEDQGNRLVTITPIIPFAKDAALSLTVYERDRLAVQELTGARRLFMIYPSPNDRLPTIKELASNVKTVQFSNDGKKLLFATDHEISVAFANDWEVQPRRQTGDIVQVARFSDKINNVQWAENYEHVVFSRGNTIKFIELDGRDHRVLADITTLQESPTQILPHFSTNQFLILSSTGVATFTFPEPQGLFGQ